MSHPTTRRNRHNYMARPTLEQEQPILIAAGGNELRPTTFSLKLGLLREPGVVVTDVPQLAASAEAGVEL